MDELMVMFVEALYRRMSRAVPTAKVGNNDATKRVIRYEGSKVLDEMQLVVECMCGDVTWEDVDILIERKDPPGQVPELHVAFGCSICRVLVRLKHIDAGRRVGH